MSSKIKQPASAGRMPALALCLRELADDLHRMGEDSNHVRLRHLNPKNRREQKAHDEAATAATAYYNAERKLRLILPPQNR